MTEQNRPNMRMRYGVHRPLEEEADKLIYGAVRKIKRHSENDILTPWKEKDRRKHEIYVPSGIPDASNRQGIYHRVMNPAQSHLNSREGIARGLQSRGFTPSINSDLPWASRDSRGYEYGHPGDSLHSFVFGDRDD